MLSSPLIAQSNTFNFSLSSDTLSIDNQIIEQDVTFIKDGNSLKFIQQVGTSTIEKSFTINSVEGDWDVENTIGNLTFSITYQTYNATFSLLGTSEGVHVELLVNQPNQTIDNFIFKDCSINY
ncbi:hypothetical protein GCM10011444_28040 [Winogradskyella haliclonae]|uniref:Uncharacterized protein n=2 Tax=Winogradskyella haliclonae TaxID=2048558 RepID=A0ABQ2C184_9FLAO|nr:hypothetical protein GCM10011444_28040 [Winogradskyella haliclonae]